VSNNTCTVAVPSCNYIKVYMKSLSGTLRIGTNATVTLSASSFYASTLSKGTQSLVFRPSANDGKSMKVVHGALGNTSVVRTLTYAEKYVECSFYDDGTTSTLYTISLLFGSASVGVLNVFSTTHYTVAGTESTVDRSVGWHRVRVTKSAVGGFVDISIDGTAVGTVWGHCVIPEFQCVAPAPGYNYYFDRLVLDGVLVDGMASVASWSATNGATVSSSSTTYDTTPNPIAIDYIEYSTTSSSSGVGSVNASSTNYSFEFAHDKLFIGTDRDQLRTYSKTTNTLAAVTNALEAGFQCLNQTRLFYAGVHDNRTFVEFSAPLSATSFDVSLDANTIRLAASGSSGDCTGLVSYLDSVYYFSYSSVYRINTGTNVASSFRSEVVSAAHGCIAPKSLAVGDSGIVFLAADGVRGYGALQSVFANDGSGLSMLSGNISGLNKTRSQEFAVLCASNTWLTAHPEAPSINGYSDAQRMAAIGAVYDNRYFLFISKDVYVFDLRRKSINNQPVCTRYKYAGLDSSVYVTSACVTRGDEYGLFVGTNNGRIYQLDTGDTDSGSDIVWHYTTTPLRYGGHYTVKHNKRMYLNAGIRPLDDTSQTQQTTLTLETDDVHTSPQTIGITMTTDADPLRIPISSRGHYLKLKLSGSITGDPIDISAMTILYNARPEVR
jgi:hypothetical protein